MRFGVLSGHQGLNGQLILPPANINQPGPIMCEERLGELLSLLSPESGLKRPDRVFVHYAEPLGDEPQVPDRVDARDGALERGHGRDLALDSGEFVRQFGHALLKLVVALVELS
jgi:hypothetical protein